MSTSMNGWPASPSLLTRTIVVNGVSFRIADNRDVETVFVYLLTRYAAEVEPLKAGQCGGYVYRANVNNPSIISNHGSATALDVNWLLHPNGAEVHTVFTQPQIDSVHAILASVPELDEVIHWGGDWFRFNGLTPDGMHFELHDHDLAKLARVADRIREGVDDMPYTEDQLKAIIKAAVHEALDAEKVDKAETVSIRQSLNQTRNDAAKAAKR